MSDHIDDKELEELNEIYRRKMESQKSHEPKKAKHEKPVRAAKSEDTHSVKATKGKINMRFSQKKTQKAQSKSE